jgi:hypothetical protein
MDGLLVMQNYVIDVGNGGGVVVEFRLFVDGVVESVWGPIGFQSFSVAVLFSSQSSLFGWEYGEKSLISATSQNYKSQTKNQRRGKDERERLDGNGNAYDQEWIARPARRSE